MSVSWMVRGISLGLAIIVGTIGARWWTFPPAVSYDMPVDGELTLGLYTPQGALLQWLVQDDFRSAGAHRESWNGLDQWGRNVPPGAYVVRGIYHAPLKVDYLMTVANPGSPSWPTKDGRGDWLSDEGNPQAVASDGESVFLGAPGSEKGFSVIAVDGKGQRLWGTSEPKHFHPRSVALAVEGDFLYALYSGPVRADADATPYAGRDAVGRAVLVCMDKRTGEPARFSRSDSQLQIAMWPYHEPANWMWDLRNNRAFSPANYAGQPRYACLDVGEPTNAIGLAVVRDHVYVSLLFENKVVEFDATTGQATGREFPLDAPAGLCRFDDHTLLAVSGREVVKIDLEKGTVSPVITSGLAAPVGIAIDHRGFIYISDWKDSFQVKVFDESGKPVRAIGKEGGRPWVGALDANGMLLPRGIAVNDTGELWVAEDDGSPPRISVWNSATGAFIKDYLGPAPYGGGTYFWTDLHDSSEVHAEGTRFKVDYAHKTSLPEAIDFRRRDANDPFTPNGHDPGPHPQVRILYHGGFEYAVMNTIPNLLSILQRQGDSYRPVAALGQVHHDTGPLGGDGTERTVWDSDVGYRRYDGFFPDCFRGHAGDSYSWTDANGDNLVQPEEMKWVPWAAEKDGSQSRKLGRWGATWGVDISKEWSFFFVSKFHDQLGVFRLDPREWTKAGAPVYDMADARPIFFDDIRHGIYSLHVTDDDKLIVSYDYESGRNPDAIAAYSLDGRKLWSVAMAKHLTGNTLHANNAVYDFNIPGVGDVVCADLYHGTFRPHFFTSDGLYVGTVFVSTPLQRFLQGCGVPINQYVGTFLDDAATGPDALWSESAKFFYQGPEGDLEVINGGNQQEHVFALKGLEKGAAGRFEATYQRPE